MPRALITGASRGIGAAVAARLVTDGWQVQDLSRTTGYDVTNVKRLRATITMSMSSTLNAVICCAGAVEPRSLADTTVEQWDASLAVNVSHQFHVLNRIAAASTAPSCVILIGSTAGTRPSPGWVAYSAAKAALHNLTVTAAAELAHRAVRVYGIAPGRCATALRATLAPDEDPTTIMQPSDVADVVAACIADTRGVLAGQILEVARRG